MASCRGAYKTSGFGPCRRVAALQNIADTFLTDWALAKCRGAEKRWGVTTVEDLENHEPNEFIERMTDKR